MFSIVAAPFCTPTNDKQKLQFFHYLINTVFYLFANSHPNRYEMMSHCGFLICIYVMILGMFEHLFTYLLAICVKMSI